MNCPRGFHYDTGCLECFYEDECPQSTTRGEGDVSYHNGQREFVVYLAGAITDEPCGYWANVAHFCEVSNQLNDMGFTVINPANDALEVFARGKDIIPVEIVRNASMRKLRLLRWLPPDRSAILCLGTHNHSGDSSVGTADELEEADAHGIHICWSVNELCEIRGTEP